MSEIKVINWDSSGFDMRKAVTELCGWRNLSGNATPMGKRIAATSWDNLSECARTVLLRHGIER